MESTTPAFAHASAMPAATWHFLKMNDATIEVPAQAAARPHVDVDAPAGALGADDAFERALDAAQRAWEAAHPAPTDDELAARAEHLAAEADATYGGTAQSAYQVGADALEDARSLAQAFQHGTGEQTAAYLQQTAGARTVVAAAPGETVEARVAVSTAPGDASVAAVDVVAAEGSAVSLSVTVDAAGDADGAGLAGTVLRVFAAAGARVDIVRTQTLDDCFCDIDDMGLFADDGARITVRQTVLGAGASFTGLACDLRGTGAELDVDTRYLGDADRTLDFNYVLRHHGPKTRCDLRANGVLAGRSSKTLRGTIDLIRGCKGAQGSENETVLLVDEDVRNKTVPVILCNEDDVAGNHGATIGHIRDEQLFYLASRGLSREAAERMFTGAIMEQAAIDAPDDAARRAVLRLGERRAPGFSALFDEEA